MWVWGLILPPPKNEKNCLIWCIVRPIFYINKKDYSKNVKPKF